MTAKSNNSVFSPHRVLSLSNKCGTIITGFYSCVSINKKDGSPAQSRRSPLFPFPGFVIPVAISSTFNCFHAAAIVSATSSELIWKPLALSVSFAAVSFSFPCSLPQAASAANPAYLLVRLMQVSSALSPILVILSGIAMLVRLLQPLNAKSPILVTPSGIIMFAKPSQFENVLSPILVQPIQPVSIHEFQADVIAIMECIAVSG